MLKRVKDDLDFAGSVIIMVAGTLVLAMVTSGVVVTLAGKVAFWVVSVACFSWLLARAAVAYSDMRKAQAKARESAEAK